MVIVQIVTGFLGSGKTTLVRHLIEGPGESQVAVVVGEFAEEGLDGDLIEASGAMVRQFSASGRGDGAKSYLPPTRAFVEEGRVSRVIIETSGVTELATVTRELAEDPVIQARAVFGPTIVVVDAGAFQAHHEHFPRQLWAQLDVADVVAINKSDKLPGEDLDAIKARITRRNPEAIVHFTYQGQIHRPTALSAPYPDFKPRAMRANWTGSLPAEFESFVYRTTKVCYDRVRFGHLLLNLKQDDWGDGKATTIARFKGVLRAWDKSHTINGLPGQLDWDPLDVKGDTRIAFIGLGLEARRETLTKILDDELDRQIEEMRRES